MPVEQQPDPTGGQLLDRLVAATEPVVAAILASAEFSAAEITGVEIRTGDPMVVRAVVTDGAGGSHAFLGSPHGEIGDTLARAVGAFLEAGLNRLPVEKRTKVGASLDAGATLGVHLNPAFGFARVTLEGAGAAPRELFTLQGG